MTARCLDSMGMPVGAAFSVVALLAIGVSCIPPRAASESPRLRPALATEASLGRGVDDEADRESAEPAVILVVLDGVRWQDVFVGADPQLVLPGEPAPRAYELMPHLHELVAERGAALGAPGQGPPIDASGPNFVSLPGYTEIFGGRRVHACADNDCVATRVPTVMDQARAIWPRTSDVAVFASWQKIERAASVHRDDLVLSVGRDRTSHAETLRDDDVMRDALDQGQRADAFPGHGTFRPDRFTASLALRYLEVRRPRLMFLGLGEPDEYAHRDDHPGYLASLRACDSALGELFNVIRRMGTRGEHTTVIVTADHGRGRDYRVHGRAFPESARVWLVAAGSGIKARGLARSTQPHRLADVAPTVRALLDLPSDRAREAGSPLTELFEPSPTRSAMMP